jgi:hypothetical protein
MTQREIEEFYNRLGLDTQAERDLFLKWSLEDSLDRRVTFILDSPNTALPYPRLGVY